MANGRLVLDTLAPLDSKRKCFRLINGVLVERTVEDVIPTLQTNAEGLKKVLEDLVKTYKNKEQELDKWKASLHHAPRTALLSHARARLANLRCRRRTRFRLCRRPEGLGVWGIKSSIRAS